NTNFEIFPGEIHCLMGKNGSGKTTLLRTIMGVQNKSGGEIFLMGQNILDWSTYTRAKKIAYLPQDPNALLFAETVKDEFRITLENHKIEPQDHTKRIKSMLEDLDLYPKANDYPRDLSVGERQRTALGSVTVINQPIIMLDEPTRGLDFEAKRKIQNLLVRWKERGASILLVTHDVEWIYEFADRISIMESGKIINSGKPLDVLSQSDIFIPLVYTFLTG
ncbi:MAG: ATP-binding cassette domain-containing protein, partial [Aliifodinibius sp.]|nr:ABC transporter ATP-binding protein [candidate division Zixibacteria bacterium]NIT61110.1 ABC transporter ATP-binding protein [Fodinibius sp.]NIV15808.1 ATP-binding cassette domain-containing protein [Fodinibius sp.]NIY29690.1 ATP-binding cassette domain-containing protein [Fodinibius sp.]